MQIHELNTFVGTPGDGDFLAIDNGNETRKVDATNLGVTTNMTLAEAQAGTVTASRVMQPSVFKQAVESFNPYPTYYGTCSTAAGTATKAVTCPEFVLRTGAMIAVEFTNENTATGTPYLNVNGTGSKRIRKTASSTENAASMWETGSVVLFVYDGSSWILTSTETNTPKSISASITASVGTLSEVSAVKWGKVVFITIAVTNSSEVASGGNIFTGTLNTTELRPVSQISGVAFLSARPIVGALAASGNIVVRNTSPTALTLASPVYIPLVYLVP